MHRNPPSEPRRIRIATQTIALAATCLPILNILNIIATTGADNLSNDLAIHVQIVTRILGGSYQWQNFLRDSFYNGHLMVFPMLLRLAFAKLTYWNAYVELFTGAGAGVLVLCLLHNALTARTHHWLRLWLWPALSALLFSVAQVNQYTFGDAAIPMGFSALGTSLVLWSLVRFRRRWRGVLLAIAGTWFASWSWAQGVIAWPFLAGAMVIVNITLRCLHNQSIPLSHRLGYTRRQFGAVAAAASLALSPYVVFTLAAPPGNIPAALRLFNLDYILSTLGWPFINGTGFITSPHLIPSLIGLAGLIGFVISLICTVLYRQWILWRSAGPSSALATLSLVSIWQLSIFRTTIAAWYAGIATIFWIGLVGLVYTLLIAGSVSPGRPLSLLSGSLATIIVLGITAAYGLSTRTYDDKVFHLYSRAPVSAACLRSQSNAPTYCEPRVFQWGIAIAGPVYRLADRLKAFNLSTFAPNQRWTLQGDFILDTVGVQEAPGVERITWLDDQTFTHRQWYDYRHLDLLLAAPNAVTWTFYLPRTAQQATFHSAVTISPSVSNDSHADGTAVIYAQGGSNARTPLFSRPLAPGDTTWQPIDFSLLSYVGQTVTLQFLSSPSTNGVGAALLFRYPHIDLLFDTNPTDAAETQRVATARPLPGPNDVIFNTRDGAEWITRGLQPSGASEVPSWTITGTQIQLEYARPVRVCLANYTHLYVRMSATKGMLPKVLQWYYKVDGAPFFDEVHSVQIPLLSDGDVHTYTFALRLADMSQAARLTGFQFALAPQPSTTGENSIRIADVRLIGWQPGDFCQ